MNIGIFTNSDKDTELSVTKQLFDLFVKNGYRVFLYDDIAEKLGSSEKFNESSDKKFDVLLTVGGDGTILRIASYCAKNNISVLGINMGKLGFLTEVEVSAIGNLPKLLKDKKFLVESRSLLSLSLDGKKYFALNDVVLNRSSTDRMIALEVSVDGMLADRYYCDGFIVSTPTGSTAYSLSAGGCILSPNVNALSLVSINSHSLHSRPIVVNDSSTISVRLLTEGEVCDVIADGQKLGSVSSSTPVEIVKASRLLNFLRLEGNNFYDRLLAKLNKWSVTF